MAFEARELRNGFGWFGTGVCVATARGDQGPIGLTINSFSSVSLEPPLILWCLDKKSDTLPVFSNCRKFAISVLSIAQADLSQSLARQGQHHLAPGIAREKGDWYLIEGALAYFACEVFDRHDAGDHIILVGLS